MVLVQVLLTTLNLVQVLLTTLNNTFLKTQTFLYLITKFNHGILEYLNKSQY